MITLILVFLISVPLVVNLLTYTLYCYEESNQNNEPIGQLLVAVLRTVANSFIYECIILALHPLGLWPSLWSKPRPGRPIVVLVHGLFHNQSGWLLFQHWFHAQGYTVACFGYPSWRTDLKTVETNLQNFLKQILTDHPDQPVHLVGHSLGGLLLRGSLSNISGGQQIKTLTTLGTPYQGSKLAPFALNSLGRYLKFQGETIQEIASRPFPRHVRLLAIKVPVDNMVLPQTALNCNLTDYTEHITRPISHIGMLYSKQIFSSVLSWIQSA